MFTIYSAGILFTCIVVAMTDIYFFMFYSHNAWRHCRLYGTKRMHRLAWSKIIYI